MHHEIISSNPDIEVTFYLSEDSGSYVSPHWHDCLELVYVLEGSITFIYESQEVILKQDEFHIVNFKAIHSVLSEKNRALVLQIPRKVLKKYIPMVELHVFKANMNPATEVEKTRLDKMKKIFQDMYVVYDIRPEGYLLRFNSLLYELLFNLIHSYSTKIAEVEVKQNDKYLKRVDEIMEYIKDHYKEKCTLKEISEHFGYNEDYLARFFKQQIGMTIVEYLYRVRAIHVYDDVMGTDQRIEEIFASNGCSNYRVAMRVFKEIYGNTPKKIQMEKKKIQQIELRKKINREDINT